MRHAPKGPCIEEPFYSPRRCVRIVHTVLYKRAIFVVLGALLLSDTSYLGDLSLLDMA